MFLLGHRAHQRRASSAIRTASPASTVPISQRCTRSQIGRAAEKGRDRAGGERDHRVHGDAHRDLREAERDRLRENVAARVDELRQQRQIKHRDFRIEQVGHEAHREQFLRAVDRQFAHLERRLPAGPHRLPGEPEEISRAGEAQRVIGVRHREHERGDAERRAQHVEDETERHAAERDQSCAQPCVIEREIR